MVAIKGAMIVLGTSYVQIQSIDFSLIPISIIIGSLSSIVLFIASFPDYQADKSKGRKTLVILLGKEKGSFIFPFIILGVYLLIFFSMLSGDLLVYALLTFSGIFFAYKAIKLVKNDFEDTKKIENAIGNTIMFSRVVGIFVVISFVIGILFKI